MGARLVRDRVADNPWPNEADKALLRPVRDDAEHDALLVQKLLEETGELLKALVAGEHGDLLGEAADLFEVVETIVHRRTGSTRADLDEIQQRKRGQIGGFTAGLAWEV